MSDNITLHKSDCALLLGGYQCTCGLYQRNSKTLPALAAEQPKHDLMKWAKDAGSSPEDLERFATYTIATRDMEIATLREENEALRRDAERYKWVLNWLWRYGLLSREKTRIDTPESFGDWFVLRKPHSIGLSVGYGKTEEAAIDAAMKGGQAMSEKPEALRLAEELYAFHAAKKEMPSVGGQMLGLERYRIVATGEAFSQILDAADKLIRQHAENERLRELLRDTTLHLGAAVDLLKRGGRKAVASDKMFVQMLTDYTKSFERGRAALRREDV